MMISRIAVIIALPLMIGETAFGQHFPGMGGTAIGQTIEAYQPPPPKPVYVSPHTYSELICLDNDNPPPPYTWWRETYITVRDSYGFESQEEDVKNTGQPCQEKGSTRPDNGPAPNSKSAAPDAYQPGTSGPPALGGPRPDLRRHIQPDVTPARSAFTYTLPWRAAPLPVFYSTQTPVTTFTCDSAVKPTAFAVDHINATVTHLDLCTGAPIATVKIAANPLQVEVTPDGTQAIVTSYNNAITFIDANSNAIRKVIQTAPNFTPSGLAIAPDGSYALVTNYEPAGSGGAALAAVDIATQSIASTIPLDRDYPQSVFLNPDATLAWVTYPWSNAVEVIDVMSGEVVRSLSFSAPFGVGFNTTGTVAYLAGGVSSGSVAVIDTATYATTSTIPAGPGACDVLVSPDEQFLSVNNYLGGSVTLIDPRSLAATTVPAKGTPRGVVLIPSQ